LVSKKGFIHNLIRSAGRLYYAVGIFFILISSLVSLFLFLEYCRYRDLTANLLELQSKYNSYLILMQQSDVYQNYLDEDKKFVQTDHSTEIFSDNLGDDDHKIVQVDAAAEERESFGVLNQRQPVRTSNNHRRPAKRASKNMSRASNNNSNNQESVTSQPNKAIFSWPVAKDSFWISSFFGPRRMGRIVRMHAGIDLAALKGTPVKAAAGGKIVRACYEFGYGNTIVIEHNRKYKTRYAHLDRILVSVGQNVLRGQKIGTVGDTGFVQAEGNNASHLHFEVYAFNKQVNPIRYLPRR
jgi:murein DD-endopeptidase MepM/ murein hydrolase activator NlpD